MRIVLCAAVVALLAPACAQSSNIEPATQASPLAKPARNVGVKLVEYSIIPTPDVGRAGKVRFSVTNAGKDKHEIVVIRTKLSPFNLPTIASGKVEEGKLDKIGEAENIASGTKTDLTLNLKPGAYVLICNIVEKHRGKTEAHYQLGMRTAFTVR